MVMAQTLMWTVEMVQALPSDGNRYEVVRGSLLVTPAPTFGHQDLVTRLLYALKRYMEREPGVYVVLSPADVLYDEHTVVQPDLFALPIAEARKRDWKLMRGLLLAIEVLSPSSARSDLVTKRTLYQEEGVPLYWIVDADHARVLEWTPEATEPIERRDVLRWHPQGAATPFEMSVAELFAPI